MRWLIAILAAACLGIAGVALYVGAGRIADDGMAATSVAAKEAGSSARTEADRALQVPAAATLSQNSGRQGRAAPADPPERQMQAVRTQEPNHTSGVVRSVAPGIIAVPDVDRATLERMEPRRPLSEIGRASQPNRMVRDQGPDVFRPVAVAAGRIETEEVTITIAGVEPVEADAQCSRPDGAEWPCGMAARTAFRSLLRGRALDCDLPEGERGEALTVACSLGATDLGAWLVENGWAHAVGGGQYGELEEAARSAGRGIFGDGPQPLPELSATQASPPEPAQPATPPAPTTPPGNGLY